MKSFTWTGTVVELRAIFIPAIERKASGQRALPRDRKVVKLLTGKK